MKSKVLETDASVETTLTDEFERARELEEAEFERARELEEAELREELEREIELDVVVVGVVKLWRTTASATSATTAFAGLPASP